MNKIALLFPGQGAFYPGALQQLRFSYLAVERTLAIVERIACLRFGRSLVKTMWDERSSPEHLLKSDSALLQLAIFTVSVAAHEVLRAEGIEADVLMGHSFGEIAALTCAGVYAVEQAAEIVCDRVESLAAAAPQDGCMAAVSAKPSDVRAMLDTWGASSPVAPVISRLTVAVENHDRQTIISGSESELDSFLAYCSMRKVSAQRLHSPYGFHHPGLAPVVSRFAARLAAYPAARLRRPVYSPILGRYYRDDDDFGDCLARHLVLPVQFSDGARFLQTEGVTIHIECGALDALSKIVVRVLGAETKTFSTFPSRLDELNNVGHIVNSVKEVKTMSVPVSNVVFPDLEAFWRERSPFMLSQIKAEFERFLSQQQFHRSSAADLPRESAMDSIQPAAAQPFAARPVAGPVGVAGKALPRAQLFDELVNIYAEAMEYPPEVFTETVELEAELGIDSVKQTEIMGRISSQYGLPPLPANVRMSDYTTMGQIADLVFAHQYEAADAAA